MGIRHWNKNVEVIIEEINKMMLESKAPTMMPADCSVLCTPTILPIIRISWDGHPTFRLILGRVPRSFIHLWASSCGFRPFDPGIIKYEKVNRRIYEIFTDKLYMSFWLSFYIFLNVRKALFYRLYGHFAFVVNLTYLGLSSYIFSIKHG